jgi:site-specific DNA recombinase
MKAAAIYCRVSTEEQAGGYSLITQMEACQQYATEHGYIVMPEHIFQDDYTGASLDRPALDRLRAVAASGQVEAVIVLDLDRIARKVVYQMILEEEFTRYGAPIEYVNDRFEATPEGGLQKQIRAALAEYERAKTRERSLRGKRGRIQAGHVLIGRMAPFGYRYCSEPHKGWLVVDEREAEIVRTIFEWYVNGDETGKRLGTTAIAARLSQRGVPTRYDSSGLDKGSKQAGAWAVSSVKRILKNETYCGLWHYGKHKRTSKSKHVVRAREEWQSVEVPAIITRDLYEAAQGQSAANRVRAKRNTRYTYLLQGRLRCPDCGHLFACEADARKGRLHLYYRCYGQRRAYGSDFATRLCGRSLRANEWDHWVWARLVRIFKNPDLIMGEVRTRSESTKAELDKLRGWLATVEGKIAQIDRKRAQLLEWALDSSVSNSLSKEVLAAKARELADERARYDREAADLRRRLEEVTIEAPDEALIRQTCAEIVRGIDTFSAEQRRWVIDLFEVTGVVQRGESPDKDVILLSGLISALEVQATSNPDAIEATTSEGCARPMPLLQARALRAPGP